MFRLGNLDCLKASSETYKKILTERSQGNMPDESLADFKLVTSLMKDIEVKKFDC